MKFRLAIFLKRHLLTFFLGAIISAFVLMIFFSSYGVENGVSSFLYRWQSAIGAIITIMGLGAFTWWQVQMSIAVRNDEEWRSRRLTAAAEAQLIREKLVQRAINLSMFRIGVTAKDVHLPILKESFIRVDLYPNELRPLEILRMNQLNRLVNDAYEADVTIGEATSRFFELHEEILELRALKEPTLDQEVEMDFLKEKLGASLKESEIKSLRASRKLGDFMLNPFSDDPLYDFSDQAAPRK